MQAGDIVMSPISSVVVVANNVRFVLYSPKLGWNRSPGINTDELDWLTFEDTRDVKTGLLTWKKRGDDVAVAHKILYAESCEGDKLIELANTFRT